MTQFPHLCHGDGTDGAAQLETQLVTRKLCQNPLRRLKTFLVTVQITATRNAGGKQNGKVHFILLAETEFLPASQLHRAPSFLRAVWILGAVVSRKAKLCLLLIAELPGEISNDSLTPGNPKHQQVIDRLNDIFRECWVLTGTVNSAKYCSIFPLLKI